jgi:hypothetical protein
MTDRELMQQALDALDLHAKQYPHMVKGYTADAAEALRARLAQPEQEPVAFRRHTSSVNQGWDEFSGTRAFDDDVPLYIAPPQREWQSLTDEEKEHYRKLGLVGVEIIETILKEKNT